MEEDCVIQIYQTNYPPNTDISISSIDLSRCELFLRREKGIAVEEHLYNKNRYFELLSYYQ